MPRAIGAPGRRDRRRLRTLMTSSQRTTNSWAKTNPIHDRCSQDRRPAVENRFHLDKMRTGSGQKEDKFVLVASFP